MRVIRIRKGLNLPLEGKPTPAVSEAVIPSVIAIKPTDFVGFAPRLLAKPGDRIKAGTPILQNKTNEKIIITSPVSGELLEIVRGEKRALLEIRIKTDDKIEHIPFGKLDVASAGREAICDLLLKSGLWALLRQRPYDVIPNPEVVPRDIFISTFDSSPLAPDFGYILKNKKEQVVAGVKALSKLTSGKVHFGLNAKADDNSLFEGIEGVEKSYFSGPHPAGNVGVQIHHTHPINKGDIVWYIHVADLATLGMLFTEGIFDGVRTISLTGPEVQKPEYVTTYIGACISDIVKVKQAAELTRIISGNVLTGDRIAADGCLGFYHHQITAIPEGKYFEFFGWAMPGMKKLSQSKMFMSKVIRPKHYKIDTNYHGGERAFVMNGQYDKVFPFDILPVFLIKAIIANDIDKMENLGIYEVSAEDFALCDFVCTSKTEVQEIVKIGLEMLRKEMS